MRSALIAVVLCTAVAIAAAQGQPTCSPSGVGPDVCPPTGNSMGQSNYQRAPHHEQPEQPAPASPQPTAAPIDFEAPFETPPSTSVPVIGAGPEIDATLGERRNIAVDDKFVYVLQGDEVVKLDKSDLHVVARTKLP